MWNIIPSFSIRGFPIQKRWRKIDDSLAGSYNLETLLEGSKGMVGILPWFVSLRKESIRCCVGFCANLLIILKICESWLGCDSWIYMPFGRLAPSVSDLYLRVHVDFNIFEIHFWSCLKFCVWNFYSFRSQIKWIFQNCNFFWSRLLVCH